MSRSFRNGCTTSRPAGRRGEIHISPDLVEQIGSFRGSMLRLRPPPRPSNHFELRRASSPTTPLREQWSTRH
eukprot:scaffold296522_cov17-Tisochrysis_lutea.AAC.1